MAFAAPALQGDMKFKQKDGSSFTGNLKGDEWFSWVEDKNGNIIKYNFDSKNYEYAEVVVNNGIADLVPAGAEVVEKNATVRSSSRTVRSTSAVKPIKIDPKVLADIWKRKREEGLNPK